MDSLLYPTIEIVEGRAFIPRVNLPRNYKELVANFYEQERENNLENYAKNLEETTNTRIRLIWNNEKGLVNICIGASSGFDLNEQGIPHFQEHNLGGNFSFYATAIAQKYVSELIKSSNK